MPPTEIFKSVGEGIVDMGVTSAGYQMGIMPFCAVLDGLPWSWQKPSDLQECVWKRGLQDLLIEQYAKHGVRFLGWQIGGPITIMSVNPLRTKADFQGTKMRGYSMWSTYFGKLGASPIDMPLRDAYMALSMGTCDTAVTGIAAHYSLKHYEVAKYGMFPYPLGDGMHDITINLDTWNALPDELKSSLQDAATDFTKWSGTYFYENYDLGYHDKLGAKGVEWVELEPEVLSWMQEEAIEMWDELAAKDPVAAKAVKTMTDYFEEVGYIE